jgi:hypothetical protein
VALSGLGANNVFEGDYQLLTPEALAACLKNHKYLPGIPTQEQVEKEGIQLAQKNTKLLNKLEEHTLQMLKKQEDINELKEMADRFINTVKI